MNNGGANDGGVRDHNRLTVLAYLPGKPSFHTLRKGKKQFSAMRRRGGVTQPSRDALRLLCLNLLEGMAPPIAVVAVAQQWLDFRVE